MTEQSLPQAGATAGESPLARRIKRFFAINPIIVKEIRSRMRGPRAFITLTVMLLSMGGIMYAMLQIILASSRYTNVLSPQIGQGLFAALAFLELVMICAVTPAVTAGAISGEKEKQTYEMLMATPLSPTSILLGKLVSALSYVLLLVFAGVPLASVVFIFGGVAPGEMVKALLVLLGVAIAYGILGLFMSALLGRTGRATVASFITVALLTVGPLFLAALVGVLRNGEPPRWILAPSPISALSAALAGTMTPNGGADIFYILSGIFNMGVSPVSTQGIPRPLYHYTLPFYLVLSVILYMLSTRLVQPTRRWRIARRELITGLVVVLLLAGGIIGGYYLTAPRYEWVPSRGGNSQTEVITAPAMPVPAPAILDQKQVVVGGDPTPTPTPADNPGTTPTPITQEGLGIVNQAQIYAAIARQLYGPDNTFGGKGPGWAVMYLASTTDDGVGDPNEPKGEPVTLSPLVQEALTKQLGDLPVEVRWIESRMKADIDTKSGAVDGGSGCVITLGNIYTQPDGSVHVSASLFFATLGGTGKTYILALKDGAWVITGTTGVEWIS